MKDKFDELINAMNYIAFMEREQTDLFSALIGILHVGNLKFKANDDGYAMFVETGDSKLAMRAVSRLLGVNSAALISAMTASAPTSAGGREEFVRNFTLDAALDTRDAMAKHIYSKVFSWLVLKINKTLMCEKNYGNFIKKIGEFKYRSMTNSVSKYYRILRSPIRFCIKWYLNLTDWLSSVDQGIIR